MTVTSFDPMWEYEGACEARSDVCTGRAQHVHHRRLRSQGGHDGPTMNVCLACHDKIHRNRAWARKRGFILHAGDRA